MIAHDTPDRCPKADEHRNAAIRFAICDVCCGNGCHWQTAKWCWRPHEAPAENRYVKVRNDELWKCIRCNSQIDEATKDRRPPGIRVRGKFRKIDLQPGKRNKDKFWQVSIQWNSRGRLKDLRVHRLTAGEDWPMTKSESETDRVGDLLQHHITMNTTERVFT